MSFDAGEAIRAEAVRQAGSSLSSRPPILGLDPGIELGGSISEVRSPHAAAGSSRPILGLDPGIELAAFALKALRLFITIHCSYYESNLSPYDPRLHSYMLLVRWSTVVILIRIRLGGDVVIEVAAAACKFCFC
jgi:hypothetical protein